MLPILRCTLKRPGFKSVLGRTAGSFTRATLFANTYYTTTKKAQQIQTQVHQPGAMHCYREVVPFKIPIQPKRVDANLQSLFEDYEPTLRQQYGIEGLYFQCESNTERLLKFVETDSIDEMARSVFRGCLQHLCNTTRGATIYHLYGPYAFGKTRFALQLIPLMKKFAKSSSDLTNEQRQWFDAAEIRYANCGEDMQTVCHHYLDGMQPEVILKLLLLKAYLYPFHSFDELLDAVTDKGLQFSLEDVLEHMHKHQTTPRLIHLVFDDVDGLAFYLPNNRRPLLKQFAELLKAALDKFPSLHVVPMFVSARGPSSMNGGKKFAPDLLTEIEMKPMSEREMHAIVKQNLQKFDVPVDSRWEKYFWLMGGCPGLAVNTAPCSDPLNKLPILPYKINDPLVVGDPAIAFCIALIGYPVNPRRRIMKTSGPPHSFEDYMLENSIYRTVPHEAFGNRQMIEMPLLTFKHYAALCSVNANESFYLHDEMRKLMDLSGDKGFDELCCRHQALRFNVASVLAKKRSAYVSFVDLFGDGFASTEMKNTLSISPDMKCQFTMKQLNSDEDLHQWLQSKKKNTVEMLKLPNGHENTAVMKCYRAKGRRPCWVWLRVVRKHQHNMSLDAKDVRQTTHPELPSNDQYTVVISNGRAFSDLMNVIGSRTVVICDDNLSTSFSAVLAPLVRNLDCWEQITTKYLKSASKGFGPWSNSEINANA